MTDLVIYPMVIMFALVAFTVIVFSSVEKNSQDLTPVSVLLTIFAILAILFVLIQLSLINDYNEKIQKNAILYYETDGQQGHVDWELKLKNKTVEEREWIRK